MVDVLVNGKKVQFDEQSMRDFQGVTVMRYPNTSKFAVIFNSGISVTVEGQRDLLGIQLLVPTTYKGTSRDARKCMQSLRCCFNYSLVFAYIHLHPLICSKLAPNKQTEG